MKKNILFTLAAAVVLLFTSCNKELDLAGTTWKTGPMTETVIYQDIEATATMDFTIIFTNATNYTVTYTGTASVLSISGTESGTYVFDGENGVLTNSDGESHTFTYNKEDKTLNAVAEMDGFSMTLVFTQQK